MATLKQIKGTAIQFLAEDPVLYVGSWSSGGTLNTTRAELAGTVGTQTAAMATGRSTPAPTAINEQYNGSSWTEVGDLNTGRGRAAAAATSYTASIVFGGINNPGDATQAITESWNGSSWTEVNDLPAVTSDMAGFGTQTSAFCIGGNRTADSNLVYSWNGTSWTSGTAINTSRQYLAASGTTPAGLIFGGRDNPQTAIYANTESWNGSAWTEVNDLNTARFQLSGFGTSTSALALGGGTPSSTAKTESWNGTSWTEVNDLASAASFQTAAAGASNSSGLAVNGTTSQEWSFPPTPLSQLQEGDMWFNSSSSALKGYGTAAGIPAATWASGGSMPATRQEGSGFGTQTAALVAGGLAPGRTNSTIEYDGSAWTTGGDLVNPTSESGGFGIQTAAIIVGGYAGSPPVTETTAAYEYNGSSWSPITSMNTARTSHPGACGITTAGLVFGGYEPSGNTAKTEDWNGSSWTELNDLNTARRQVQGVGTQTAALAATGYVTAASGAAETWDGTSWTNITSVGTTRFGSGTGINGVNTSALLFGGLSPGPTYHAQTELWNGSSWTELNDLSTARNYGASGGTSSAAIYSGGYTGTAMTSDVEEWTAPAVVSTITTS